MSAGLVPETDAYCCSISVIGRPYGLQYRKAGGLGGSSDNPLNFVTLCGSVNTLGSCRRLPCEQRSQEMHTRGSWLRPAGGPAPAEVIVLSEQAAGKAVWLTADGSHSTRTARWRERMTAAAILAESDVARHGQAVLDRVKKAEWPAGNGRQVAEALWSLHDTLGIYDGILNEVIDPAAEFPELAHRDGGLERALAMIAEDVSAWAAELDRLVPARGTDS